MANKIILNGSGMVNSEIRKKTSIGLKNLSVKGMNKHRRRSFKKYRGQGRK